jgi:hypothetical protein
LTGDQGCDGVVRVQERRARYHTGQPRSSRQPKPLALAIAQGA